MQIYDTVPGVRAAAMDTVAMAMAVAVAAMAMVVLVVLVVGGGGGGGVCGDKAIATDRDTRDRSRACPTIRPRQWFPRSLIGLHTRSARIYCSV